MSSENAPERAPENSPDPFDGHGRGRDPHDDRSAIHRAPRVTGNGHGHEAELEAELEVALEAELVDLARALDARGSRLVGSGDGLSGDALERIFAASDMQLPIASAPVVGRIGRGSQAPLFAQTLGFHRLLRIAAVIATAAGIGLAVYAVARSLEGSDAPLKNGTGAPQGMLAQGENPALPQANPSDPPVPETRIPRFRARDLDTALSGALAARTTVRPAASAVLALSGDDRAAGRLAVSRATLPSGDFAEDSGPANGMAADEDAAAVAFAGDLDDAFASLDGMPATFDELSGEFSALLAASGARR